MIDEENSQKSHHSARDRVEQVLETCRHGLFGPLMKHQRHGGQCQKLETQVHRDQVSRETLRDQRSHGDQVERVESRDPLLHLHVLEGIEEHTGVQQYCHCQEAPAQRVSSEDYSHTF